MDIDTNVKCLEWKLDRNYTLRARIKVNSSGRNRKKLTPISIPLSYKFGLSLVLETNKV